MVQTQPLTEAEKARSWRLARERRCPHCQQAVSLADAIAMVQGDGVERWVEVQTEDGKVGPLRVWDVNPQSMRILDEEHPNYRRSNSMNESPKTLQLPATPKGASDLLERLLLEIRGSGLW